MQKINLIINIDNNEILTEEINKAIEGVLKQKTREYFSNFIEKELKRVFENALKKYTEEHGHYGEIKNLLKESVEKQVNYEFNKALDDANMSTLDIMAKIEDKLKNIDDIVETVAERKIKSSFITTIVENEVQKIIPDAVFKILKSKVEEQ